MKIISTTKPRPPQSSRSAVEPQEKLTLPNDRADLTYESERPPVGRLAKGGATGALGGAALGGFAGLAGIVFGGAVDVVYGTAHASTIQVGLMAVAGAAMGAGLGALMSGLGHRDEVRDRNGFTDLLKANNVTSAESPTFGHWAQINNQGWSDRETIPEKAKPALTSILQSLSERGMKFNATNPQEALLKMESRKLKVDGTKVSHMAELQHIDALNGGGLVVLDQAKRQTLDTMGRMHKEGFQFLQTPGTEGPGRNLSFHKAYERLKMSESDAIGHGFYLRSPQAATYRVTDPESVAIVYALDGAGETTLPPLAEEARNLHELGLQIGVEKPEGTFYSKTPFGAYLNLKEQGDVTDLAFAGTKIAVPTDQREESLGKLTDWGLTEAFGSLEVFSKTMTYEAARQVTPQLLQSSDSLKSFGENIDIAIALFDTMKGGKGRFLLPNKLPDGYLRALNEKLADE